jgi:hypothetical protein
MITNGDFESFTGGMATSWTIFEDPSIIYVVSEDSGFTGSAQKIEVSNVISWGMIYYQTLVFELDETYVASFWYKTSGSNNFSLAVSNLGNTEFVFIEAGIGVTNGEWQYYEREFIYTNDVATQIKIHTNALGSIWIDDFSLKKIVRQQLVEFNNVNINPGTYTWSLEVSDGTDSVFMNSNTFTVIEEPVCTPAVNPCGSAECGDVQNGTCGSVSCGTCGGGYTCSGGSCVALSGDVYYADPENGDTSNGDGSSSNPWGTVGSIIGANKLSSGDLLYLRTGNHGSVSLTANNADYITIMTEGGHVPIVTDITFSGASKWIISGLTITKEGFKGPTDRTELVVIQDYSQNIIFENNNIYTLLDNSGWGKSEWDSAFDAIYLNEVDDIIIRNNFIRNVMHGLRLSDVSNLLFENNEINGYRTDGIRGGYTLDNIILRNNIIRNNYRTGDDHPDGIQFFGHLGTVSNVEISGNTLIQFDRDRTDAFGPTRSAQGIFINSVCDIMYDFIIVNNLVIYEHSHAINIGFLDGGKIMGNTLIDPLLGENIEDGWANIPQISVQMKGLGNVIVRNNIAPRIVLRPTCSNTPFYLITSTNWESFFDDPNNWNVSNNIITSESDVDDYFIDAYNYDVRLKQYSTAIDAGYDLPGILDHDIDGNPRPQGSGWDIGAYEYI